MAIIEERKKTFNVGDKVYYFVNGRLHNMTYKVTKVEDGKIYILPTDCLINGVVPTLDNYAPVTLPLSGEENVVGVGRFAIYKAEGELKEKVEKFRTKDFVVKEILKAFGVEYTREDEKMRKVLMKRTTQQLFGLYGCLIFPANGSSGVVSVDKEGKMQVQLFVEEEPIMEVKEPIMPKTDKVVEKPKTNGYKVLTMGNSFRCPKDGKKLRNNPCEGCECFNGYTEKTRLGQKTKCAY